MEIIEIRRVGLPEDLNLRRYNLVNMDVNGGMLICCSHSASALCPDCRAIVLGHAKEVFVVREEGGKWIEASV